MRGENMYVFEGSDRCRLIVEMALGAHADSLDKVSLVLDKDIERDELLLSEHQTLRLMAMLDDSNDFGLYMFEDVGNGQRFICTRAFGGFVIWLLDTSSTYLEGSSFDSRRGLVLDSKGEIEPHGTLALYLESRRGLTLDSKDEPELRKALAQCLEKANANTGVTELHHMECALDRIHSELLTVMNNRRTYLKMQGRPATDPFYERVRAMRAEVRELRAQVIQALSERGADV